MAQNACQQMDLNAFYQSLRNLVSNVYNANHKLLAASEFLLSMDATTAAAMGMDTTTRDDINNLRTAINEYLDFYDGTATDRTRVMKTEINKLRYLL